MSKDADTIYATWLDWLEVIAHQVTVMRNHEQIWRTMVSGLERRAGDKSGIFKAHYTRLYLETQIIAIRRSVDRDPRTISLGRLLAAIRDNPEIVTRGRFLDSGGNQEDWALRLREAKFAEYAKLGTEHIDPKLAASDYDKLVAATAVVKTYVDKLIAHTEAAYAHPEDASDLSMTWGDVHSAIDAISAIVGRWFSILKDTARMFRPVIQDDWKGPFRQPLFVSLDADRQAWMEDEKFDFTTRDDGWN